MTATATRQTITLPIDMNETSGAGRMRMTEVSGAISLRDDEFNAEISGLLEGTAEPDTARCVDISTKAAIRRMIVPGLMAVITPVAMGFVFGPAALGGLLAGVTVSGVAMAIFMSNAGGAWDNAKKSFEGGGFKMPDGEVLPKGSEAHDAAVVGDTVGDPFKDTAGPSLNILVKLISVVALVIAPLIASGAYTSLWDMAFQLGGN